MILRTTGGFGDNETAYAPIVTSNLCSVRRNRWTTGQAHFRRPFAGSPSIKTRSDSVSRASIRDLTLTVQALHCRQHPSTSKGRPLKHTTIERPERCAHHFQMKTSNHAMHTIITEPTLPVWLQHAEPAVQVVTPSSTMNLDEGRCSLDPSF